MVQLSILLTAGVETGTDAVVPRMIEHLRCHRFHSSDL